MIKIFLTFLLLVNTCIAIEMQVDYAVFKYNDSLNLIELYYSFTDKELTFKPSGDYFKANIEFETIVKSTSLVDTVRWNQDLMSESFGKSTSSLLIGMKVMLIPKGSISIDFQTFDSNNIIFNKVLSIDSPQFPNSSISFSDLQIASVIEPKNRKTGQWNDSFLKNSLYVVPNPGADIIGDSITLNCYFEIYNADKYASDGVEIIYKVLDGGQKEVFHYPRKKKSYSQAMVEYVSLPIDALPSGVYFLKVEVLNADGNILNIKSLTKRFYVSNFNIPPQPLTEFHESLEFESSEFATFSEDAVDLHFAQIKPMVSDYEMGIWDNCSTLGAKQRYLFSFWVNRNPDTTKPFNVALEDFRQKVKYANKNYAFGLNNQGWKTPRGRVLIKYGHPSLIDRHEISGTQPAYEIWKYDQLEGGTEFVFVDLKSTGSFEMVHSTVPGEIRYDSWYQRYIEKQDPDANFKYNSDPLKQ